MFLLDESAMHCLAGLKVEDKKGKDDMVYFDINGAKSHVDVCVFMFENFKMSGQIMSFETNRDFVENDITQEVLNTTEFDGFEPEK